MADDVETRLTRALQARASEITPDRLRHRELRARRTTRLRPVLVAAALIAVVVGVGVAARALRTENPRIGASSATYVGSRWLLVSVRNGQQHSAVPAALRAGIAFGTDGEVVMSDSVNALSGRYTTTATGFVVSEAGSTAAGYAGTDPTTLLVIKAVDAIALGPMTTGTSAPTVESRARVQAGRLVIEASGYELTFERAGPSGTPPTILP
jgi:META domain